MTAVCRWLDAFGPEARRRIHVGLLEVVCDCEGGVKGGATSGHTALLLLSRLALGTPTLRRTKRYTQHGQFKIAKQTWTHFSPSAGTHLRGGWGERSAYVCISQEGNF